MNLGHLGGGSPKDLISSRRTKGMTSALFLNSSVNPTSCSACGSGPVVSPDRTLPSNELQFPGGSQQSAHSSILPVSRDVLPCWVVRHGSGGNRLLGQQGLSEQWKHFPNVLQGLCTHHPPCLKCPPPPPSTGLISLPPSGLCSLSPFRRGLSCVSSSLKLLSYLPPQRRLLSFYSLFL